MIPILLSEEEKDTLKNLFKEKVDAVIDGKKIKDPTERITNRKTFYENINFELNNIGIQDKIEDIILADLEMITRIKKYIDDENIQFGSYSKENIKGMPFAKIYKAYDKFSKNNINKDLIDKLKITVCPYCNSNFVNSRDGSTTAQLDHFFPRSKYPIFAISLFNLIPSCYACNHIKREKEISISPYDKKLKSDHLLSFSYSIDNVNFLHNKEAIKVELRAKESKPNDLTGNIAILKLKSAYEIQNDLVSELIKKSVIYNSNKIDELYSQYNGLFSSKDEVVRLIFGNYIKKEDFGKRPLAKLTKDICEELGVYLKL